MTSNTHTSSTHAAVICVASLQHQRETPGLETMKGTEEISLVKRYLGIIELFRFRKQAGRSAGRRQDSVRQKVEGLS